MHLSKRLCFTQTEENIRVWRKSEEEQGQGQRVLGRVGRGRTYSERAVALWEYRASAVWNSEAQDSI